jgi:transcriptional regulator with XRE-family HTH domain
MPFNPQTTSRILESRGLDEEQLRDLTGIALTTIVGLLEGSKTPSGNQIAKLADRLAVPGYAFFLANFIPRPSPIIDFRTQDPEPLKYGPNAKSFKRYLQLHEFLKELSVRLNRKPAEEIIEIDMEQNPEQIAAAVRQQLGLKDAQATAENKKEFIRIFRKRIESYGIYVIQDHNISYDIDGFAVHDEDNIANFIMFNSKSRNSGAQTFTIAHELGHILSRRSAISNNYEYDNDFESYCNRFASVLLLPREDFLGFSREQ